MSAGIDLLLGAAGVAVVLDLLKPKKKGPKS